MRRHDSHCSPTTKNQYKHETLTDASEAPGAIRVCKLEYQRVQISRQSSLPDYMTTGNRNKSISTVDVKLQLVFFQWWPAQSESCLKFSAKIKLMHFLWHQHLKPGTHVLSRIQEEGQKKINNIYPQITLTAVFYPTTKYCFMYTSISTTITHYKFHVHYEHIWFHKSNSPEITSSVSREIQY